MLTFATGGSGSSPHLAGTLFKSMAGIDIREIPYKGVSAAIPDLVGGRVTMIFSPIAEVLPSAREDKLRALAVTSSKRSRVLPQLPTIDESGVPGFELTSWCALFALAGTSIAIVRKLHSATAKAMTQAEMRTRISDIGFEAVDGSPEALATLIQSEAQRWSRIVNDSGIRP
jgi:tripartite-type tricarboxylate transporter receptor subunit TctC